MSAPEELRFDADGFVDMGAFADDGTDLDPAALADLREALLSDPVDEPAPEEWDVLLDTALEAAVDEGPFALDAAPAEGVDGVVADDLADWLAADPGADGAGGTAAGEVADEATEDGAAEAPVDEPDPLAGALDLDLDLDLEGGGLGADPFDVDAGPLPDEGDAGDGGFDLGDAP